MFANGAATAAMSYALSQLAQRRRGSTGEVAGSGDLDADAALSVDVEDFAEREVWGEGFISANKIVGAEMAAFSQYSPTSGYELCTIACPVERTHPIFGFPERGWSFSIKTIGSHVACPVATSCGGMSSPPLHTHGSKRFRPNTIDMRIRPDLRTGRGRYQSQRVNSFSPADRGFSEIMLYSPGNGLMLMRGGNRRTIEIYGH